jgi:hypothetical protein
MANTITNPETHLLNYLTNQIGNTLTLIKEQEKSLDILTDGDDEFTDAIDEVIQSKLTDLTVYKFRMIWLQSQVKQIKSFKQFLIN